MANTYTITQAILPNGDTVKFKDSGAVRTVSGKGLSTEDYTTAEKTKLANVEAGAQVNTITGVKGNAESGYRTGNVNLTAKNIGALALTGGTMTGDIYRVLNNVDASKTDNGLTETFYAGLNYLDVNNKVLTRLETIANPNGGVASYWYIKNYDTSGTGVALKGIKIAMHKNGMLEYVVSDPDKFRSAIDVDSAPCLIVSCGALSSLPTTINNAAITADMAVIKADLSNPAAQVANDWQAVCVDGAVTVSGTISGTSALTLYLMKSRT